MLIKKYKHLHVALPVRDEDSHLFATLDSLAAQTCHNFDVVICVNQPDAFWYDAATQAIAERNEKMLMRLEKDKHHYPFPIELIDRCTRGLGWTSDKHGVGWARKTIMDQISATAKSNSLIMSLDADTLFGPSYLQSVLDNFNAHPKAVGLSVPYYHQLTGECHLDRAMLRYEIYMRTYALNMWRIGNPYRFTALGSAIVTPVWSYKAIGGMTPKKSGEDFYFLQKLVKYGPLLCWNIEHVYPAARYSDRVFFGTGPALIKGSQGEWGSYPIYHHSLFDLVKDTCDAFPALHTQQMATPMDGFLQGVFGDQDVFGPLRENNKKCDRFVKACFERIDGLRVLQFLKHKQKLCQYNDNQCLKDFLMQAGYSRQTEDVSLDESCIDRLDHIRNFLYQMENGLKILID